MRKHWVIGIVSVAVLVATTALFFLPRLASPAVEYTGGAVHEIRGIFCNHKDAAQFIADAYRQGQARGDLMFSIQLGRGNIRYDRYPNTSPLVLAETPICGVIIEPLSMTVLGEGGESYEYSNDVPDPLFFYVNWSVQFPGVNIPVRTGYVLPNVIPTPFSVDVDVAKTIPRGGE